MMVPMYFIFVIAFVFVIVGAAAILLASKR